MLYIFKNRNNIPNINVIGYKFSIALEDLVKDGMIKGDIKNPKTGYFVPLTTEISIEVLGDNPVIIGVGEEYVDAGATAWDELDGDITSSI